MKEARRRSQHEMGLQVSHGVHSEVGGIQCGGIHQGEECNLRLPRNFLGLKHRLTGKSF